MFANDLNWFFKRAEYLNEYRCLKKKKHSEKRNDRMLARFLLNFIMMMLKYDIYKAIVFGLVIKKLLTQQWRRAPTFNMTNK